VNSKTKLKWCLEFGYEKHPSTGVLRTTNAVIYKTSRTHEGAKKGLVLCNEADKSDPDFSFDMCFHVTNLPLILSFHFASLKDG